MSESDCGVLDERSGFGKEELRERFSGLWREYEGLVRAIVERAKVEDPEALIAEVARKGWEAFAVTVRRERKRVAEGWPGYNWRRWFGQIAVRVVMDAKKRARRARRAYGVRAEARFAMAHLRDEEGGNVFFDEQDRWEPLDVDQVAVPADKNDPAAAAEHAETMERLGRALGCLSEKEVYALARWAMGETNWVTAAALKVSWRELVAMRGHALERVRARFGEG